MKYAVVADTPIALPAKVRAYLQRKARLARKPSTSEYRAKQQRLQRLRSRAGK